MGQVANIIHKENSVLQNRFKFNYSLRKTDMSESGGAKTVYTYDLFKPYFRNRLWLRWRASPVLKLLHVCGRLRCGSVPATGFCHTSNGILLFCPPLLSHDASFLRPQRVGVTKQQETEA